MRRRMKRGCWPKLPRERILELVDGTLVSEVPRAVATRNLCIPLSVGDRGGLMVASADPENTQAFEDMTFLLGLDVGGVVVADRHDMQSLIDELYS